MYKNSEQRSSKNIWQEEIKNLTSSDFDGHTEFDKMSQKERLLWLSEGARFMTQIGRQNK